MNKEYKRESVHDHTDKHSSNEDWEDKFCLVENQMDSWNVWFVGVYHQIMVVSCNSHYMQHKETERKKIDVRYTVTKKLYKNIVSM
jgi:hypothetical protein